MSLEVREARLDDIRGISAIFRAPINVWQRLNARGYVEDVGYDGLTLYERWLHGGPWMSVETGAVFLNHLLLGGGIALVAVSDGLIQGYAEAYHSVETAPFHSHLHLAHLVVDPAQIDTGIEVVLTDALIEQARRLKCRQITVLRSGPGSVAEAVRERVELKDIACLQRYTLAARQGQVFYRAVEHLNDNPEQIRGWLMPIGRLTSARQQWEMLWPSIWNTIPEMVARRTHRLKVSAAGQEAFLCLQQQLYDPRSADVYCWTAKSLTPQLVSAIRDWAHREGYRNLSLPIFEETIPTLGAEAEEVGYTQNVCAVALGK
ncbi:MAG: hypothetical protein GYB67_08445 [Chloroflexi bacterium]|nr:hypothetical protein [Chloroflexota bacterium]